MKVLQKLLIFLIMGLFLTSCSNTEAKVETDKEPLNILWLVAEDLSPYIPPFGDSTVQTPNLSKLAAEGVRYNNVYSISGVCSPSRAAIATGMYPSSIGAHHMRTLFQQPAARKMGIINYECVPPSEVKMVSELLREKGYYCTNNAKEDYQFFASKMAWDESSIYAHWRNRPKGKPFYSIFNFGVTHESNMWNPFGRTFDLDTFPPSRSNKKWWLQFQGVKKPLFVPEDLAVDVPPYLPDNEIVRKDMRRMYSNIVEMDKHVGRILDQLKEDGLLENTIIVWYTDHGGPLPRQKRLLYDSGLKVPMIIRYPDKRRAGEIDERMISFIDFAPTLLSQVNIRPPDYIQGSAFEGKYASTEDRKYIHAAADRFDESYDMIRAVRDKRFKYLKNFKTDQPYYLPLAYRENMATMQELLRMKEEGTLNKVQLQWFRTEKPKEELFDTKKDPHELNNLALNTSYQDKLKELRIECEKWMQDIDDKGFMPEEELIKSFWPDKIQPKTDELSYEIKEGYIELKCTTAGANIGYKTKDDLLPHLGWNIYNNPIRMDSVPMHAIAHRIGFAPSDTLQIQTIQ